MTGITTVFACEDSLDGILTGVYDAWESRLGSSRVRLELQLEITPELFCEYKNIKTSAEKAEKVFRTIQRRMGEEALTHICRAAAAAEPQKADAIYRMIVLGLSLERGSEVVNCLTCIPVAEVMRLSQRCWYEAHRLMGFIRFSELKSGILYAKIRPVSQVLPFVAPFFADRLRHENWMIHDEGRKLAALHQRDSGWVLTDAAELKEEQLRAVSEEQTAFEELWKCFHDSIAIRERCNPRLQRQLLPLRYRPYMTEFHKESDMAEAKGENAEAGRQTLQYP